MKRKMSKAAIQKEEKKEKKFVYCEAPSHWDCLKK